MFVYIESINTALNLGHVVRAPAGVSGGVGRITFLLSDGTSYVVSGLGTTQEEAVAALSQILQQIGSFQLEEQGV